MNYELRIRQILFLFWGLLLVGCGGTQPAKTAGGAIFEISPEILMSRADTLVDIGSVRAGEVIKYDARLRNVGTEPLVVKEISTSCGCTSAEYDKQPIAPGGEGNFSFRFDSRGMWGVQIKLIEIHTSASPRPYQVMVQAEITEN